VEKVVCKETHPVSNHQTKLSEWYILQPFLFSACR
jgi:hypothetical protein